MRREDIPNTIWERDDDLSNGGMLLNLWSWTNPRCNMSGLYRIPRRFLVEGRLADGELTLALEETEEAGLILYRDGILWRRDRVAQIRTRTCQIAKSIGTDMQDVLGSRPFAAFLSEYCRPEHWLLDKLTEANNQGRSAGRWDEIVAALTEARERFIRASAEVHETRSGGRIGEGHLRFHCQEQGQEQDQEQGQDGRAVSAGVATSQGGLP